MSWVELVREVAAEFGDEPDDDDVDHILWEHTGFPGFWQGDPAAECARQVRAYYEHLGDPEWNCGAYPHRSGDAGASSVPGDESGSNGPVEDRT